MVAILIGIRDRDQERIQFVVAAAAADGRELIATLAKSGQASSGVSGQSATLQQIEALADFRVKTAAHGVDESMSVGLAGIDRSNDG